MWAWRRLMAPPGPDASAVMGPSDRSAQVRVTGGRLRLAQPVKRTMLLNTMPFVHAYLAG